MESEELDELIEEIGEIVRAASRDEPHWKTVWAQIRETNLAFKTIRYPTAAARNAAWTTFQKIVEQAKEAQDQSRRSFNTRKETSERHKSEIMALAEQATPPPAWAEGLTNIILAPLILPVKMIMDAVLPGPPIDETREMLKHCSARMSEGWRYLSQHKGEMLGRDRHDAWEALNDAKERLQEAWDRWKGIQQQAYEARQVRREVNQRRHEEWQQRVRERVTRLEARIDKLESVLAHKRSHLEDLEEKRASAWNEGFRERVDGWIEEEVRSIDDIESTLRDLESQLADTRSKLE